MRPRSGSPLAIRPASALKSFSKSIPSVLHSARWVLFTDRLPVRTQHRAASILRSHIAGSKLRRRSPTNPFSSSHVPDGTRPTFPGATQSRAGRRALAYLKPPARPPCRRRSTRSSRRRSARKRSAAIFTAKPTFWPNRPESRQFAMAFFAPTFKVVLATVHMSLTDALAQISTERYVD